MRRYHEVQVSRCMKILDDQTDEHPSESWPSSLWRQFGPSMHRGILWMFSKLHWTSTCHRLILSTLWLQTIIEWTSWWDGNEWGWWWVIYGEILEHESSDEPDQVSESDLHNIILVKISLPNRLEVGVWQSWRIGVALPNFLHTCTCSIFMRRILHTGVQYHCTYFNHTLLEWFSRVIYRCDPLLRSK